MLSIEERAPEHHLSAFAAPETMPVLIERIQRLLDTDRRITIVKRYHGGNGAPDVYPGLLVDRSAYDDGIHISGPSQFSGGNFMVRLRGLSSVTEGFSVAAQASDTEQAARDRYHSDHPEETTLVQVDGFGEGPNDRIEITYYNSHGVGRTTVIAFDLTSRLEHAEQDARVVEALATRQEAWTAADLTALAEQIRYHQRTVAQQFDPALRSRWDRADD